MERKNSRHYLMTGRKGVCMGAADVIPRGFWRDNSLHDWNI